MCWPIGYKLASHLMTLLAVLQQLSCSRWTYYARHRDSTCGTTHQSLAPVRKVKGSGGAAAAAAAVRTVAAGAS
jgi:hypothetical protein